MIEIRKTTITRAGIIMAIVSAIALSAGTWVTSAAGTVPPQGGGSCSAVSAEDLANALTKASGNGNLACGDFSVCSWQPNRVELANFPGCLTTNLTVLCMDDNGKWVDNNVSNIGVDPDTRIVSFDVTQDGTCALFPAPSTPNALYGGVILP